MYGGISHGHDGSGVGRAAIAILASKVVRVMAASTEVDSIIYTFKIFLLPDQNRVV